MEGFGGAGAVHHADRVACERWTCVLLLLVVEIEERGREVSCFTCWCCPVVLYASCCNCWIPASDLIDVLGALEFAALYCTVGGYVVLLSLREIRCLTFVEAAVARPEVDCTVKCLCGEYTALVSRG